MASSHKENFLTSFSYPSKKKMFLLSLSDKHIKHTPHITLRLSHSMLSPTQTQTHHPFFFPFNPFSSETSSVSQVENDMECMINEAFLPEIMAKIGPKQTQEVILEDFAYFNPQNASISGEDFFVDQLLNLNNENSTEEDRDNHGGLLVVVKEEQLQEEVPKNSKDYPFLSPPFETERNKDDFGSVLSVPAEEPDLEWLSNFVEESFSQISTPPYPARPGPPKPEPGVLKPTHFTTTPPATLSKARRSKRGRTGGRVWSAALAAASPDWAPPKKRRKREARGGGPPRRCDHCGVQKTPQWRAGPLGSKTLCNACGVRFKSGRLLPEYRPACSPTFSGELHSNSHRKVMEMRKKKGVDGHGSAQSSFPDPVQILDSTWNVQVN